MKTTTNVTNDILQALITADDTAKTRALKALLGAERPPDPPVREPYLTMRQVCRELAINPATLWRWRVPCHRFGARPRYRLCEVEAYLASPQFQAVAAELRAARRAAQTAGEVRP